MIISFTPGQILKMRHLESDEIKALVGIIKLGGVVPVNDTCVDKLRAVGLMRAKAGRAWVRMEINGKKVAPFLGSKPKRIMTDHQHVASMFLRKVKKIVSVDPFTIKEWKFASTLAKQYDAAELEAMIDRYIANTNRYKINFEHFYYQKSRLHRDITVERTIDDKGGSGEGVSLFEKWKAEGAATSRRGACDLT